MSRFQFEMGAPPPDALKLGPEVGDVFKKDGGPAGFMLVVSENGSTYGCLCLDVEGNVVGVTQGNAYYFSRRRFVGRVEEFPHMQITWENP